MTFSSPDFYRRKNLWKFILLGFAMLIGITTLWYTESFLKVLREEERKKVELWGSAMQMIIASDENTELTLTSQILQSNTTIPVILTNEDYHIIAHRNFPRRVSQDSVALGAKLREIRAGREPIVVHFGEDQVNYLFYENSTLLKQLRFYPLVLLGVIAVFMSLSYLAFSRARKAEQNQVWNGLAKETAHQIGTPLSSLMGWVELLSLKPGHEEMVREMQIDLNRLNTITDRFSKIGSHPTLSRLDIAEVTERAVTYLKSRIAERITVQFENKLTTSFTCELNEQLYGWVIENLIRNATDAIAKKGVITIQISSLSKGVCIEVSDTGKGIPLKMQRAVFRPGYSTKKRGWGLGLSLARRIIEDYHHGKIYVAHSEPGKGTTFRITLPA